jgi:hypothetical protein
LAPERQELALTVEKVAFWRLWEALAEAISSDYNVITEVFPA